MKTQEQIRGRIEEMEQRLGLLEEAVSEEMQKAPKQDVLRLRFLYKEKEVFKHAIEQLNWALSED